MMRWRVYEWLKAEKQDRRITQREMIEAVELMSCSELREAVIEYLLTKK